MAQTNILLEAGTNELEVVEFYLDEATFPTVDAGDVNADPQAAAGEGSYRGYYGVNVAKVLEIIRMPKVTELPEVQHPAYSGPSTCARGSSLVDLAMWLGKTHTQTDEQPKTIVTEFNNVTTAFMVSGVNRNPPHQLGKGGTAQQIRGRGIQQYGHRRGQAGRTHRLPAGPGKVVANLNPKLGLRLDDLGADWDNTGYRALVADDSALVREMQRDLLEKAGFTVEVVENGREAWERLEDFKRRAEEGNRPITDFVHVMVSDIEMPVMDGLNLTHRIKTDRCSSNCRWCSSPP